MAERGRHLCLLGDASSVHLRRWACEMRSRDWRVSVVTARPQPIDGVQLRTLPPVRRSRDWLWRVAAARAAVDALAPDIVHAHYISSYGYLAARCRRHPLVMTAWGSDLLVTPEASRPMRVLTRWILRHADLFTGDSADLLQAAQALGLRAPARLLHWGVDTAVFKPARWADKPAFDIVSLRSWEPNYHIDTLIAALKRLRSRRPEAPLRLHLLGGGPLEGALRQQVAAAGLDAQVRFHGRLDDAGMAAVLARCKVSVSVPASDATSVAMLESMACGLAVVASDLPANRAWLGSGELPLVAAGDAASLAQRLQRLLDDDALARRLGEANHARIERDGRRDAQMDTMSRWYESLL